MRAVRFKVLSLNIFSDSPGMAALIQHSGADIVGLQEVRKTGPEIAQALGFHFLQQGPDVAVVSRFPIVETTQKGGAIIEIANKKIAFFSRHFLHAPYQPYQLLRIPYRNDRFISTAAEAIKEAKSVHGKEASDLIADVEEVGDLPAIAVFDANEPSHLDWTKKAKEIGRHPLKVVWPSSKAMAAAGFIDAYRELSPDEILDPGNTWSTKTSPNDLLDHHDRIDYVFYRGKGLRARCVDIVGETYGPASIVYTPYPTDHRGVLVEFELEL